MQMETVVERVEEGEFHMVAALLLEDGGKEQQLEQKMALEALAVQQEVKSMKA